MVQDHLALFRKAGFSVSKNPGVKAPLGDFDGDADVNSFQRIRYSGVTTGRML